MNTRPWASAAQCRVVRRFRRGLPVDAALDEAFPDLDPARGREIDQDSALLTLPALRYCQSGMWCNSVNSTHAALAS